ncbi:ABC transporter ATP-binding protein [Rhodoligotrophos defluvii]|uniref:ABC transporter ATP-binding protein n=1 Tax=Rhodoligotrophos defluvii TaxID=2561934 RepID=UPI0010CA00AA|nr:ABC transporter ATP-binding protein [Rhodoligotrophos defluvii]
MAEPLLQISGLYARYGLADVLRGISLEVDGGEIVSLFGRNGVGKTTLLKTIAGWLEPRLGSIQYRGEELGGRDAVAVCHRGIGFVPEDRRIFPGLTVSENLCLGFYQLRDVASREKLERLEAIYRRFPRLSERRSQIGTTLSGGEQQMLAIARVLIGKPKLILVDEPTEGLAPRIVDEIMAIIAGLAREGVAVLLVEQNVQRALDISSRFYAIERGAVVFEGAPGSAADRERLFATMVA